MPILLPKVVANSEHQLTPTFDQSFATNLFGALNKKHLAEKTSFKWKNNRIHWERYIIFAYICYT